MYISWKPLYIYEEVRSMNEWMNAWMNGKIDKLELNIFSEIAQYIIIISKLYSKLQSDV